MMAAGWLVLLVSLLYYHFWIGALGAYWWLLMGGREEAAE